MVCRPVRGADRFKAILDRIGKGRLFTANDRLPARTGIAVGPDAGFGDLPRMGLGHTQLGGHGAGVQGQEARVGNQPLAQAAVAVSRSRPRKLSGQIAHPVAIGAVDSAFGLVRGGTGVPAYPALAVMVDGLPVEGGEVEVTPKDRCLQLRVENISKETIHTPSFRVTSYYISVLEYLPPCSIPCHYRRKLVRAC